MGLSDGHSVAGVPASTRSGEVVAALAKTDFLTRLRKTHDVTVLPFSEDVNSDHAVTLGKIDAEEEDASDVSSPRPKAEAAEVKPEAIDWAKTLAPKGMETRIGQSLRQLVQTERGTPVSGVILLSDGGQNAGIPPEAAVELAQEAKMPVFTIGLGSDRQPINVAVSDFAVPTRAYPGDRYTVTGYVQSQGLAGKVVTVQLLGRPTGDGGAGKPGVGDVIETRQVTLGGDGEVLPVKFELTPEGPGRRTLCFRVQAPPGDSNAADNLREADIEIVARKNHVLLLAGGPMREYHFVRNQLFRDRSTTVDVLLQSGKPGISQEAKKVLDEFPATREQMFDYDCVVAFDPNWQALKSGQIDLLEKWVGEQGGGLIVIAGAVYAGKGVGGWTQDAAMTPIRATCIPSSSPVGSPRWRTTPTRARSPGRSSSPREGIDADFLWLADTATANRQAWAGFPGVYGYCPVRGPKPGATVFSRFSDPRTAQGGKQPVYFAGQFYGAGSVFYMGSGEMWRLRSIDEAYFEQFYTKLIRHVSQGRLLRGSSRGVLLVGQDRYLLGNTVELRAQLSNARLEPLDAPTVNVRVVLPDNQMRTVVLRADPARAGAYHGQFSAIQEGGYRIELPIPDSSNEQLTRRIQVKTPDLERENPRRNDALLSGIAKNTGGKYYVGMAPAIDPRSPRALVGQLKDQTSTVILTAAPNPEWEETWLRWLMTALCGLLCLEWLIRRLLKLA